MTRPPPRGLGFLFDPAVDAPTARRAGTGPAGGNRSPRGAATQQILASVVHTASLRRLDARDVLVNLLRMRQPIVSPALTLPQ